jgi:hypothetical protein
MIFSEPSETEKPFPIPSDLFPTFPMTYDPIRFLRAAIERQKSGGFLNGKKESKKNLREREPKSLILPSSSIGGSHVAQPPTEERAMFYVKNVPTWERIARVMMAVAMIAYGLLELKGQTMGYVVAGGGVMVLMTGFLGFCPMCAMVGRKLH